MDEAGGFVTLAMVSLFLRVSRKTREVIVHLHREARIGIVDTIDSSL